ncbi:MAG TPA: pyridoxamine 5'-phosphate oxidase [Geminicoccaceae bacterium]|nr:pyridoxamine 5'-phosphate oxidase [Geminicoccaceae bacterium]
MDPNLAAMRRDYAAEGLTEAAAHADPLAQFRRWFDDACRAELHEPNAMTLATVDAAGQPAARMVLLKGVDARGLAFFTNRDSRKARELLANPRAALVFWWGPLQRQVRFEGTIEEVAAAEADAYFESRPKGSQIAAWSSAQSRVIPDRAALEAEVRRHEERFAAGPVPRPPFWGGYRLVPAVVEFWHGRQSRLHDRLRYTRTPDGWRIERLAP